MFNLTSTDEINHRSEKKERIEASDSKVMVIYPSILFLPLIPEQGHRWGLIHTLH